ncbi:AT-rich interactive domain-containing protein 4B [Prunus yedoensis var. nudiflora]|uniref:AT-rich interactive domain-containing protein 4B n=1 Tax=Prunus yedoensis var. nudiflora TaxID=2094558 RepID=A0A314UZN5_PRUYE|nr:AT-rich interactive domain-containing protein 4B [Prunus yedoensis var. nudiflora]
MDYHSQNQQTLTHSSYMYNSIDNQLLKKATKFLLSVSVVTFCIPNSSLLSCLHSLNFYFSTFPYQLFTHTIDKNCMFLICNLLLVVLAKCSGLIRSPSPPHRTNDETTFKNREGGSGFESPMLETEEPAMQKEDVKVESMESAEHVAAEEGQQSEPLINQVETDAEKAAEEYKDQKEQKPESEFIVPEEEEEENGTLAEEDEDGNGMLSSSTEELNKKFEDFIRRMKEELRIEAQRQLIMV